MKDDIRQFLRPVLNAKRTGQYIKHLMEMRGLSVRDIQSVFGFFYPQAVYAWLCGKSVPSVDNLLVLAKLFGVTIDEILAYDEVRIDFGESA